MGLLAAWVFDRALKTVCNYQVRVTQMLLPIEFQYKPRGVLFSFPTVGTLLVVLTLHVSSLKSFCWV